MRVETQNIGGLGSAAVAGTGASAGTSSGSSVQGRDSESLDTVALSNASSLIDLAKNVSSPERQSKIADLVQQIRQGSYQASPVETSRAMVASASN